VRGLVKKTPRRVKKPWGHELVWAETDLYVGKILCIRPGEALSVQLHRSKDETLYLRSGSIRLLMGPDPESLIDVGLREGEAVRITPGTVHSIEAITEAEVLETSTPQLADVVRLADRYGRVMDRSEEG
jgi:mannose-6-phosphate isomerase